MGINRPKIAAEALTHEPEPRVSELLLAELRQGLAAVEAYADQHGSFAQLVREHYYRGHGCAGI
jgi:hypothetical protein